MSEFFSGVTFSEQSVTPSDDAIFHRAVLPDGILTGCAFSYSGSTLTMGAGYLLICGRLVRHNAVQYWPIVDATSGYARLVLTVDLSRASTKDAFDQVIDSIEYASSLNGFAALQQTDINGAGTRYQIDACVVSLGTGGITGIVQAASQIGSDNMYAPAGYGLGQDAGTVAASLAELDGLIKTGWYRLTDPSGAAKIFGCNFSKASVHVEAYDANAGRQILSMIGSPTRAQRSRVGGVWGPWSIENPPMELGMEYRTVELWGSQPVYTQRIAYTADSFTSQNIALPHGISNLGIVISASAVWKRTDVADDGWRQLPSIDYEFNTYEGQINFVGAETIEFRLGSSLSTRIAKSTEPVYVTLKYTKQ